MRRLARLDDPSSRAIGVEMTRDDLARCAVSGWTLATLEMRSMTSGYEAHLQRIDSPAPRVAIPRVRHGKVYFKVL